MDGLSADKLKVLLHPQNNNGYNVHKTNDDEKHVMNAGKGGSDAAATEFSNFGNSVVLTTLQDNTRGKWKTAQASINAL